MRTKKHAIIVSIIVAAVSLALASALFFCTNDSRTMEYISNAFLGIFASSVATLFVFVFEYREERSKAITAFCRHIDRISFVMDQIIFLPPNSDGTLDDRYLQNRENRSIIEEQCDKYIEINSLSYKIEELFFEIDFFTDFPIKEWWEMHHLKPVDKKNHTKLTRSQKRIAKENAKALYRDEHYEGKKKQRIRTKIITPLNDLLNHVSSYALNDFQWYRDGRSEKEDAVIEGLLKLQGLFYDTNSDTVARKPHPWLMATYDLSNTLVGSKLFWMDSEEDKDGV